MDYEQASQYIFDPSKIMDTWSPQDMRLTFTIKCKKKFNFWSLKRLEAAFLTPRNQYNISQTSYVIWKTVKFYQNDKKLLPITDISKIILHWKGNYWQTLYILVSFSDTSGRNKICDFLRKNFGIPQIHQKLMSTHA